MSKKLAEGIDALVLDVKFGRGAFMKRLEDARVLARAMVDIGKAMRRPTVALLTGMDRPLRRAVGPGLTGFEVNNPLPNPRLRLYRGTELITENDDWGSAANASEVVAAIFHTHAFSLSAFSRDAALLVTLPPGSYTAHIEDPAGAGVTLAEIYDASESPSAEYQRLVNISTRGFVGPGEDTLIGGLIVTGNVAKRVLVRAVGPRLAGFGVTGALADPRLSVFDASGTAIAANDDWGAGANSAAELAETAAASGAFDLDTGSRDAALLITLAPGTYTAHVTSAKDGATGIALIEIYE